MISPLYLLGKSGRQEIAMRKILITYLPASLLLAILAMVLFTCGGGGDGGGGVSRTATLTGLSIDGPSSMPVNGTATYTAMASWDDNTTSVVTPNWDVDLQMASITPGGVLSCQDIASNQTATITATYSSGGITETDTMDVTIVNGTPVAWQPNWVTGSAWFEENIGAGDVYSSYLYMFNSDSSFRRYGYENPPDTSDYVTGSWSIASGNLILTIPGQGTITVTLLVDPFILAQVSVDEGTGTPYNTTWEWTGPGPYPFDESLIPGTYVNQFGDTWIFNSNGTGSTTGDGGWTYTWSVDDDGILKVVFPNGYVGSMYERPGTQLSSTSYTIIEWAFVIHTPTGEFGAYYGGMRLTRQ